MIQTRRWNFSSKARYYSKADSIVVSIPKSGRTWLRVFLYSYLCTLHGRDLTLDEKEIFVSAIPKVIFTHDLWEHMVIARFKDRIRGKFLVPANEVNRKPILLLARDPKDTIVSLFFQLTKRDRKYEGSVSEMIRHPKYGIYTIIQIMNTWMEEWSGRSRLKLIRYEDCRSDPEGSFRELLTFLGFGQIDASIFSRALEFSSFENMKAMETKGQFQTSALQPSNMSDPDSFKVRKGLVGGYRNYLSSEDTFFCDRAITSLDKRYGYC
jgi:hypothetical protein